MADKKQHKNQFQYFLDNPVTLPKAMEECSTQIRLAAQSLAKDELMIDHLKILRDLALALNRVTYTKYLTIEPTDERIAEYEKALTIEQAAEGILEDLQLFIIGKSVQASNIKTYVSYVVRFPVEVTDERLSKLLEILTTRFNGKKTDKK